MSGGGYDVVVDVDDEVNLLNRHLNLLVKLTTSIRVI